MQLTLCCPTLFGLEGIVADELRFGGRLTDVHAENGRVLFTGDENTLAWANLNLRCAERVLIRIGTFKAKTFDQLFEGVKALPWEQFIPADGAFPVKGHSLDSALHSIPDCQKIIKKAVVSRLGAKYGQTWFDEIGEKYQIQFAIMHDVAELYLDTSGAGLHKRGYRANSNAAPLRETLAAAVVKLARWRGRDPFLDPFCGSGTIGIEAAQMAAGMAPGLNRRFAFEKLEGFDVDLWAEMKEDARAAVNRHVRIRIAGSDISSLVVEKAEENARRAGLGDMLDDGRLTFRQGDAREACPEEGMAPGLLIANPPYGEQSNPKSASIQSMMKHVADNLKANFAGWTAWMLTSDRTLPQQMRLKESRKTVLFNGPLECRFFRFDMVAGSNRRKPREEADE